MILNYADIVNQQRLTGPSTNNNDDDLDSMEGSVGRSRSNISGLNHESDSPRAARATSALVHPKTPADWPPSTRKPGAPLFNEELEQDGGDIMAFEKSTPKDQSGALAQKTRDSFISATYQPS